MRVELAEILRCPAAHDASSLITLASARERGVLIEGVLGCPHCGAEYALTDGAVNFADPRGVPHPQRAGSDADAAMRLAALLRLEYAAVPVMHVALLGDYARAACAIARLVPVHVISINATVVEYDLVDTLWVSPAQQLPFADDALVGAACDTIHVPLLADVTRVVRPGGRVMAPISVPVPAGCRELARDEREWVAEVVARPHTSPLTPLRRRTTLSAEA